MAKMIDKIPSYEGEKKTWESFSVNLPQQYVVYNTRSIKGWEFDFCILAENVGLFIVEVKGWKVEDIFNVVGEDSIILTREEKPQPSPRKQARGYRFNMVNLLKQELGMNPLVMDLVCYPMISKEEYRAKRLDVVSDETETIFKEDLEDASSLYRKIIGRYNINKSTPHDEFNAKRFALVRHHFEPNFNLKENVEDLNPGYSRLRVEVESLTDEKIGEIVDEYFLGIKEIVFVNSKETLRALIKKVEDKLSSKKLIPEKGNLSIGTREIDVNQFADFYSIFNFEIYVVENIGELVKDSVLVEEGLMNDEQKVVLRRLADITLFNFQQYEIEHAATNTNIMVAAGAGTGKTYSMVSRVAYLCNRTTDAVVDIVSDIAMITFTKDAAENMNSRLKRMFMNYFVLTSNEKYMHLIEDMSQIQISTIHKFAISLLHKECMRMGLGYDSQVSSETYDRKRIYHEKLDAYLSEKTEKNADFVHQLSMQTYELEDMLIGFCDQLYNRISKEQTLHAFETTAFDAIIIDEAHHSSANSYKKVMEYFTPKLWLGMTATPDKRDDNLEGRNIYEIFNHQIAYEIRLQDAMEEDLLCPFHYFGITDLEVIADEAKGAAEKLENFQYLTSDERVANVMKQAEFFSYSGDRVKGLIFCSRIDEAKELSKKFNECGWRTQVLSGNDSESARADAIERLAADAGENILDYIISVDIFSEGVDVPEINQVIMLRPTESPIVFIQQLGRGLRKAENKEYVVVLDFIGNYRNNFMIPIALSGDRSYNKDNIRRYVTEGGRVIPGASTIHFDEISRKRIFQAIDTANFNDVKLIRENYTNLKNKLGHIPKLSDFDRYGEMDVLRIFENNSLGSYYKFLVKYEKEYTVRLSEEEEKVIEFICKKLASGKRIHELELLNRMLKYHHGLLNILQQALEKKYHRAMTENCAENVVNIMTNEFPTSAAKKTYASCVFLEKEGKDYRVSENFEKMLGNREFYEILEEVVEFGIARYQMNYSKTYQDTDLVLYQKYTYEDACRLLNWERNEVPLNIGGYKYDKKTKTFPVFINYDKQEDISDTTKYEDHFLTADRLIAISKSGRSRDSEDVQNFLKAKERGIDVQLFVRKNKDDKISKEFYYLGRMTATGRTEEFVMANTDKTAVEIEWALDTPVREDIYEYIING